VWAIDNRTPYAVGKTWGRDKDGVHEWIVGVKATFDILSNGQLVLAPEQIPVSLAPSWNGEEGLSSLKYEADLVGLKPTTDVVLNATAYAPGGRPTTEFIASVRVDQLYKAIRIVGHRVWESDLLGRNPSAAQSIARIGIIYERAYGGSDLSDPNPKRQRWDPRNPVGCGLTPSVGQPMPNFETISGSRRQNGPAGFGAIASHWSPRRELLGTYDESWQAGRYPLLPEDWDPRSRLCSPPDQRPEAHLRGGEVVILENLTPNGKLQFTIPKIRLRFRTRIDGHTEEHSAELSTVIMEPDYPRLALVYQSCLLIRNNVDYLDKTLVTLKPHIRWATSST